MEKVCGFTIFFSFLTSSLYSMAPVVDPGQLLDLAQQQQSSVQVPVIQAPEQLSVGVASADQKEQQEADAQEVDGKDQKESVGGIDTVDIEDGGNWLLKRKAVEDTIDRIEQINRQFSLILETRVDYRIKQNQLDNEYDKFVADIGFDIGDSEKMLVDLIAQVERERAQQGDLTEPERELLEKLNEKQKELDGLRETLTMLQAIETRTNEVLATVDNQIKVANEHQNQAWRNFQEIKQVLSDEKAEELYYQTDGLYKNLQEIYAYLKTTLNSYFNEQFQAMRDQMNKIKSSVNNLAQSGIDLKQEFERLEKLDLEQDEKRVDERIEKEVEQRVDDALSRQKAEQQTGWFGYISHLIGSFFKSIGRFFSDSWFFVSSFWRSSEVKIIRPDNALPAE